MNRSRSHDGFQRALCAAPGGATSSTPPAGTNQDVNMSNSENDSGGSALQHVVPFRRTPRGMRTPPHHQPPPLPLPPSPSAIGSSPGYDTVPDQSLAISPYSNNTPRGSGHSTTTFMDGPTSASEARLFVQTVQTHAVAAVQAVASGLQAEYNHKVVELSFGNNFVL